MHFSQKSETAIFNEMIKVDSREDGAGFMAVKLWLWLLIFLRGARARARAGVGGRARAHAVKMKGRTRG
jgi:hypothetical protein